MIFCFLYFFPLFLLSVFGDDLFVRGGFFEWDLRFCDGFVVLKVLMVAWV